MFFKLMIQKILKFHQIKIKKLKFKIKFKEIIRNKILEMFKESIRKF